jgi:hypothetical protein
VVSVEVFCNLSDSNATLHRVLKALLGKAIAVSLPSLCPAEFYAYLQPQKLKSLKFVTLQDAFGFSWISGEGACISFADYLKLVDIRFPLLRELDISDTSMDNFVNDLIPRWETLFPQVDVLSAPMWKARQGFRQTDVTWPDYAAQIRTVAAKLSHLNLGSVATFHQSADSFRIEDVVGGVLENEVGLPLGSITFHESCRIWHLVRWDDEHVESLERLFEESFDGDFEQVKALGSVQNSAGETGRLAWAVKKLHDIVQRCSWNRLYHITLARSTVKVISRLNKLVPKRPVAGAIHSHFVNPNPCACSYRANTPLLISVPAIPTGGGNQVSVSEFAQPVQPNAGSEFGDFSFSDTPKRPAQPNAGSEFGGFSFSNTPKPPAQPSSGSEFGGFSSSNTPKPPAQPSASEEFGGFSFSDTPKPAQSSAGSGFSFSNTPKPPAQPSASEEFGGFSFSDTPKPAQSSAGSGFSFSDTPKPPAQPSTGSEFGGFFEKPAGASAASGSGGSLPFSDAVVAASGHPNSLGGILLSSFCFILEAFPWRDLVPTPRHWMSLTSRETDLAGLIFRVPRHKINQSRILEFFTTAETLEPLLNASSGDQRSQAFVDLTVIPFAKSASTERDFTVVMRAMAAAKSIDEYLNILFERVTATGIHVAMIGPLSGPAFDQILQGSKDLKITAARLFFDFYQLIFQRQQLNAVIAAGVSAQEFKELLAINVHHIQGRSWSAGDEELYQYALWKKVLGHTDQKFATRGSIRNAVWVASSAPRIPPLYKTMLCHGSSMKYRSSCLRDLLTVTDPSSTAAIGPNHPDFPALAAAAKILGITPGSVSSDPIYVSKK